MTADDEGKFSALIQALAETFGAKFTQGQLLGYRIGLGSLSIAEIERAVSRAIETLKFMPKPAELRELSGEIAPAAKSALAWQSAKKAVHAVGAYGSPKFNDPVINAVIRNMGGWVAFCGRDPAAFETFTRRDFERIYATLGPCVTPENTKALVGIHNAATREIEAAEAMRELVEIKP